MPPKPSRVTRASRKSKSKFPNPPNTGPAFQKLVALMSRLRAPGGCPWDREQSHSSLRTYLIEEAYEVLDALEAADDAKFAEELGDLLLQVLFHSQIAQEENRFNIADVIREIYEKMIRRHPHVFGTKRANTSAEVLRNWELIKKEEQRARSPNTPAAAKKDAPESLLDGVPRALPALLEGYQLTRKAARVGFDWHNVDGIFEKLEEEARELREALAHAAAAANEATANSSSNYAPSAKRTGGELGTASPKHNARIECELGDILFVAVNLARFLKVDPEIAMKKASNKFSRRFREMERLARAQGTTFAKVPRAQMESLWEHSKQSELSEDFPK
ncbi:MAG: nucleoside triphosphate pyrophosphohydrolase [Candidatus Acidiferrum sp.]